ncbi:MAG: hypothetical protein H7X95_13060 [Deltaproteobacteria bacterium]|nr:hypothetical protein [Deltaproteobacteria bacterium]
MTYKAMRFRGVSVGFSVGFCLLASAAVGVGACGGSSGPAAPTIDLKVGAMVPRTGPNANSDWISAVELAFLHFTNGLKTAKNPKHLGLTLEERDTASNEATAYQTKIDFAALGAKVIVTEATAASIGANKANYDPAAGSPVPLVAFTSTSSSLNKPTATDADPLRQAALQDVANWFFRSCPLSDALSKIRLSVVFQSGAAGDVNGDGKVKVVFVGTTDPATMSSIAGDVKAFAAAAPNPTVFVSEQVIFDPGADPNTFNWSAVLQKMTDTFNESTQAEDGLPDIIVNKSLPNVAIPLIRTYNQARHTIAMLQDGSFRRNTILAALGSSADGQQGPSNIAYEPNASGRTFASEQQKATGWAPAAFESQAYDAMTLALLAMVKAASALDDPALVTPEQVRQALEQINDPAGEIIRTGSTEFAKAVDLIAAGTPINYEGASGPVNFDAVGNVLSKAVLWKIQAGKFVEMQVYDCTVGSDCPLVP